MKALIRRLKAWLAPPPPVPENRDPHLDYGEQSGAHPDEHPPAELHKGRRRLKETYTSHWDLDYMPREEMERLLGQDPPGRDDDEPDRR